MDKRKRYLFVIPRLGGGGAERVMVTLANNLCDRVDIRIATITSPESFYPLDSRVQVTGFGCEVNRSNKLRLLWSELVGVFKSLRCLRNEVKQWQPDAVLSFLNETNLLVLLLKCLGIIKCRLVVSERADPNKRGKLTIWLERNFYPKAEVIVCQSQQVAKFFREKDQNKIQVIPNPICAEAIPALYTGERKKTVVGVGRLFPQKNFALLINAFSKLGDDFADYTLEIYGEGHLWDALEKQSKELGLAERVCLMGAKKNVMHYIGDASVFVMTSDFEGFPNALVEAMATGLPVITTDFTPGNAPDIVHPENGIVVPVNDEAALVNAMKQVLTDRQMAESMSRENRKMLDTLAEGKIAALWGAVL